MEIQTGVEPHDHIVQFYERNRDLIEVVSAYLVDGLEAGEVAIIVATMEHRLAFEESMEVSGIDVTALRASGRLITLDADETMERFMVGETPDAEAFDAVIGDLVREAGRSGRPIRVYGEMVAQLCDGGYVASAVELESLWNDLGRHVPFALFCSYAARSVIGEHHAEALDAICHLHSAIVGISAAQSSNDLDLEGREWTYRFRSSAHAPRAARRFVVEALERWGLPDLVDDAAIVMSELATNAVVHTQSDVVVAVSLHNEAVRVSVRDGISVPPLVRVPTQSADGGRGMALVERLASRWGIDPVVDGKVVWAEFAVDERKQPRLPTKR